MKPFHGLKLTRLGKDMKSRVDGPAPVDPSVVG
jgi:hypothetical protein